MNIISNYLNNTGNTAVFPIIGLLVFLLFFISLIIYLFYLDKSYVREMSEMPLGNETINNEELKNLKDNHDGNKQ